MEFCLDEAIEILRRTPHVLEALLSELPEEWTERNEGADSWSPYDVVGHLIHGEKTDWIPRTRIILNDSSDKKFESFDRLAQLREAKKKRIEDLLGEFRKLRRENLKTLRNLRITDVLLDSEGIHPEFGAVTLRQLLAAWVVHDVTHIAQIVRVMAKQYDEAVGPWKAYMRILQE